MHQLYYVIFPVEASLFSLHLSIALVEGILDFVFGCWKVADWCCSYKKNCFRYQLVWAENPADLFLTYTFQVF